MHNNIKFSLVPLAAIVASMIIAPRAIVTVHAQGTMAGMKMSAIPPLQGQTIVRDSAAQSRKICRNRKFPHPQDPSQFITFLPPGAGVGICRYL